MPEIRLGGLDGSNLLGYLAALGTLRVLSTKLEVRMSWVEESSYIPAIHCASLGTEDELIAALRARVCGEDTIDRSWTIGEDLTLTRVAMHECLMASASRARPESRVEADFLTAFGSDVFGAGPKKEAMSDTEFRTMSGAGHQHFLGFMKELAKTTTGDDLNRALFSAWDYQDGRPSLRWDPADYRPHALRADDPSTDPIRTMRGANRLAVEALPLFPTVPSGRRVRTTGFQERDGGMQVSWPIWILPLELGTAQSLLATKEIQMVSDGTLRARGVTQVFQARRFTEGKYRNFSPGRPTI